jgi:hypothetical protein
MGPGSSLPFWPAAAPDSADCSCVVGKGVVMENTPPVQNGSRPPSQPDAPADAQVVAPAPVLYGQPADPGIGVDSPARPWPSGPFTWQQPERPWEGNGVASAGGGAQSEPAAVSDWDSTGPIPVSPGAPESAEPGAGPAAAGPAYGRPPEWRSGHGWRNDGLRWGGQERDAQEWEAQESDAREWDAQEWDGREWDGQEWDGQESDGTGWALADDDQPASYPAGVQRGRAFLAGPGGSPPPAFVEPWRSDRPVPATRRTASRRAVAVVATPVIVLVAVAVLVLTLLDAVRLSAERHVSLPAVAAGPLSALTYPEQQERGVSQSMGRIVASGNTVVAIASQATGGVVRQQFLVSADDGASWRLAPVRRPGGGQPPVGYPAARLAGGPGGWLAVGPQAIWTSPNGLSWTLSSTHGIAPMLPGDYMWVLNSTSDGFLAAGVGAAGNGAEQAVIWTSRNGLTWHRETAAQLGLAGDGQRVESISYITSHGDDTVMSGTVVSGSTSQSAAWLSTDGGSAWTPVTVPADHGAGTSITGLGSDQSGMIAIRPGHSASGARDGVAYFSPNGRAWQYAATIEAPGGWSPSLVKGSDFGFVVTGAGATGQILAYTSTGSGALWRPTASLGEAASETVAGATVAPAGTVIVVGSTAASNAGQQPIFLETTAGNPVVREISLTGIPGAVVPELAVSGLAIAGSEQVAVGSADGYPAVWQKTAGGRLILDTSLAQVSADPNLSALTDVTHGPAGWLAVGAPGPAVFTSADGTTWQAARPVTDDLAGVSAVAAAGGPAGYVIAGKLVTPGGTSMADVWWSPNLTSWTRAGDVSDVNGSSQVLAVAAGTHGFVAAGSQDGKPASWESANGRSWTATVLPLPAGASAGVLQQVAINGNQVAALGQETTATGSVPFAEVSVNGGASWAQVPFSAPGPGVAFTALTADAGGFTAAAQFGSPGQQQVAIWTSADGNSWAQVTASGLLGLVPGAAYRIDALAPSGQRVTGVASITTQQNQRLVLITLPAR